MKELVSLGFWLLCYNLFHQAASRIPRRETAIIDKVPFYLTSPWFLSYSSFWQNQLMWDLGLPSSDMESPEAVSAKVQELDGEFDFVMLAEYFDESLVILAKMLCWDLKEVIQINITTMISDRCDT